MAANETSRINLYLHAENTRIFKQQNERILPVCIITGFLGSGKTTLLNHILTNKSNLRIAAAINDFAELNIDKSLIKSTTNTNGNINDNDGNNIIELSNGCICCHLLDDLKNVVWKMLSEDDSNNDNNINNDINYLIIETSGISDPFSVIRTLDAKFGKCYRARLDSVITVIDSDSFYHSIDNSVSTTCTSTIANPSNTTMVSQLTYADIIIMNKIDLLKQQQEQNGSDDGDNKCKEDICNIVESKIRKYNSNASLHRTTRCNVPLSSILDVYIPSKISHNSGQVTSQSRATITHESTNVPIYVSDTGGSLRCPSSSFSNSRNSSNVSSSHSTLSFSPLNNKNNMNKFVSVSVTIEKEPISLYKLQQFVCDIVDNCSKGKGKVSRVKGILWIQGINYRCILHLSGRGRLSFEIDGLWTGPPSTNIVFIGTDLNLEKIRNDFTNCCCCNDELANNNRSESNGRSSTKSCIMNISKNNNNMNTNTQTLHYHANFKKGINLLKETKEFQLLVSSKNTDDGGDSTLFPLKVEERLSAEDYVLQQSNSSCCYFRLTGSQIYGYSEEEIENTLRIDTNRMNIDLVDAVNAWVCNESSKPFLTYQYKEAVIVDDRGEERSSGIKQQSDKRSSSSSNSKDIVVLCYPIGVGGATEPANNMKILLREASKVLSYHFRHVQVCKCG